MLHAIRGLPPQANNAATALHQHFRWALCFLVLSVTLCALVYGFCLVSVNSASATFNSAYASEINLFVMALIAGALVTATCYCVDAVLILYNLRDLPSS